MLRRRLLMIMGPVVALLVVSAVVAVWLLQGVLRDMRRLEAQRSVLLQQQPAGPVVGHVGSEQDALIERFRMLVLGISLVFLLVINLSILGLLRVASMITRPVDALLEGARQLGQERFDYRLKLPGNDEFGQLAQAYNRMAEQLQANEQRKMDTLAQVALTMNHELNNSISIIQLQLRLIDRRIGNDAAQEKSLMQIRDSLGRMASTVDALKHVRRIVLTDYVPGTKMLDLRKSVDADDEQSGAVTATDRSAE